MSLGHSYDLSLCDVRRMELRHAPRRSTVQLLLRERSRRLANRDLVAIALVTSKSRDHSEFTVSHSRSQGTPPVHFQCDLLVAETLCGYVAAAVLCASHIRYHDHNNVPCPCRPAGHAYKYMRAHIYIARRTFWRQKAHMQQKVLSWQ